MDRPRKKRKTNIGKAVTAQSRSTFARDTNNFCPVTRLTRTRRPPLEVEGPLPLPSSESRKHGWPQRSTRSRSCELLSRLFSSTTVIELKERVESTNLESNSVKWCFLTNYSILSLQVLRGSAASVTVFLP